MQTILEQFEKHASSASFHYADDTCKEWDLADREKAAAMELYSQHPELRDEMRVIINKQLWRIYP